MSLARHPEARFQDFGGPYYPKLAHVLTTRLDSEYLTLEILQMLGLAVTKGHDDLTHTNISVTTTDGYEWFSGLRFSEAGRLVLIAIPCYTDEQRVDDTAADRAVAVYYQHANIDDPRRLLDRLLRRCDTISISRSLSCR